MKTRTTTLAILTAVLASAAVASAQGETQPPPQKAKPEEFKCPVCGSPCVNKAELMKQRRMHMKANADRMGPDGGPAMEGPRAADGDQASPAEQLQKRAMRFDIDGDGQLSEAERAALRAYRAELRKERGGPPEDRPAE